MSGAVHRGRSKKDTVKTLTLRLTQQEYDALKVIAESRMRSASGQAVREIQRAIERYQGGES